MYSRRQEGRVGAKASAGPINQAIAGLRRGRPRPGFRRGALEAGAGPLLQRRLHRVGPGLPQGRLSESQARFRGSHRHPPEEPREARASRASWSIGPNVLAGHFKDRSDAAPTFFWAAVAWGEWALSEGKLEAARTGAAETIRDYALTVIGIDPVFEEGGGYRILGRLHDQAPWIPFVTGWVSRDEAVKALRLAMQQNKRNFANRHFLAEALYRRGRQGEGGGDRSGGGARGRRAVAAAPDRRAQDPGGRAAKPRGLEESRVARGRSGSARRSSRTVRPLIGCRQSGAISASGASTKRRVSMRGCGRTGSGRARRAPPRSRMSRSISRGPFGNDGVRPTRLLDALQLAQQRRGRTLPGDRGDRVPERRLGRIADRVGAIEGRHGQDRRHGGDFFESGLDSGAAVAAVGAERDVGDARSRAGG